jgi:Cupin superfamily protein
LSHALGPEMSARIDINCYITPPHSQGFKPHFDVHDVFVAQIKGTKRWHHAQNSYDLPVWGQHYGKDKPEPSPNEEVILNPGDLLYLPRGTVHWATSNDDTSVHIAIGVHPILYKDVLLNAIQKLSSEDVRFRRALPLGFARNSHLQELAATEIRQLIREFDISISPERIVADAVIEATSIGTPDLRNHLTDLDQLDALTLSTRVRRRPRLRFSISYDSGPICIAFHGKTIRLPGSVCAEIRYITEVTGDTFCAADIPGDLNPAGRLVLVRTLVREGFLTLH